jgi:hypothetical protein
MMVTVHTFQFPSEAYPLKALLESAGIPVVLINENLISINPLMSQMLGGLKLTVSEQDEAQARLLIENYFRSPETTQPELDPKWKAQFEEVQTWCPNCEAYPVFIQKEPDIRTISQFLKAVLMAPFFIRKKKHFCAACLHEWEQ